ncbi:MAG: PD40 domain-containing protein [Phycisphaerales bacterium]|nr:PD40 domain-containing protein [Phycisphaerales bacterium]
MNRHAKTAILVGLGLVGITGLSVAGIGSISAKAWWTDGGSIRVPSVQAPVRQILWQPAKPVRGVGSPASAETTEETPPATGVVANVDEYEPRLSADGTVMVFVRRRPGQNADLFTQRWTPEGWTAPAAIESINTDHDELGPEFSRDGKSLYFYSDRDGGMGGYDIWVARSSEEGWGTPVNLGSGINTDWNEYGPAITPNSDRLFFSSNRPRAGEPPMQAEGWGATLRERRDRHDYDLYVSSLADGEPAAATALADLNTANDEGSPAMSPVGDFLYFASDRPGGIGGYDLYRVRIRPAGVGSAENLGPAVNSLANDLDPGLSTDGFRVYFSSNRREAAEQSPPTQGATAGGSISGAPEERYGLWSSGAREVYLDREPVQWRKALADLWDALWPWILLLPLLVLAGILLYRILRSEKWRRRFGQLSLLAQCLLISLVIHALVGTLLAAWKVGTGIIELVQRSGGSQVILSSAAGTGGDIAGQIRGGAGSSSIELPALASISAAPGIATEMKTEEMPLPSAGVVIAKPVDVQAAIEPAASSAPLASQMPEQVSTEAAAMPTIQTAAAVDTEAAPALPVSVNTASAPAGINSNGAPTTQIGPQSEARLSQPTEIAMESVEAAPRAGSSPISPPPAPSRTDAQALDPATPRLATAGTATAEREMATLPVSSSSSFAPAAPTTGSAPGSIRTSIAPRESSTAAAQPGRFAVPGNDDRAAAATQPVIAGTGTGIEPMDAKDVQVSVPQAASGAPSVVREPSTQIGGSSGSNFTAAAPVVGGVGSVGGQAIRAAIAPVQGTRSEPARLGASVGEAQPGAGPAFAPGASGAVSALPQAQGDGEGAAIPSVTSGGGGSRIAEAGPAIGGLPTKTHGVGLAAAPVIGVDTGTGTSASIAPGRGLGDTAPGGGRLSSDLFAGAGRDPASGGASGLSAIGPADGGGLGDARLPEVSDEPVKPVETFAQRAPEVRDEILEKMGGSADTENAVGLALGWFARHQEADGRWTGREFDDRCGSCDGDAAFDADAAMTGMALLCYLGAGHTHQADGPYREVVSKAITWLVQRQAQNGDLRRGETMYGQTVATVAMCEALAMTKDPALAGPTRRAVAFVVDTAARPRAAGQRVSEQDTSVLGWLVMTMESARRAGISVPRATFESAGTWLDYVSSPGSPGLYSYRKGESPSLAMTAEAMFVQQLIGHKRTEARMAESAEFILSVPPKWENGAPTYCWYYATLALFEQQGDAWSRWNEAIMPELLKHQRQDGGAAGSWDPQDEWSRMGGRIYQTAVCTLSLEVYYRYKPR